MADRLSIFADPDTTISGEVTITSKGGNSLDNVISKLESLINEAKLLRAGHEEWSWGDVVKDSEIDLEDLNLTLEDEDD